MPKIYINVNKRRKEVNEKEKIICYQGLSVLKQYWWPKKCFLDKKNANEKFGFITDGA